MQLATLLLLAAEGVEEETKNPILPVENELFWAAVTFLTMWALMKWVFLPPVIKTMENRSAKIREDLDAADHARAQAALAEAEYEQSLAGARAEASRIIDDARARAEARRKELMGAAEAEVAELRAAAQAEIAEAKQAAMDELRSSVATLAVGAAEAVVQKRLDEAAQLRVVEEYVNQAASRN